jgi:glycosyltransferase involved in cell wall biosynthesis
LALTVPDAPPPIVWVLTAETSGGSPAIRRYSDSILDPLRALVPIEVRESGVRGRLATALRWVSTRYGPVGAVNRAAVGRRSARVVVADHINASVAAWKLLRANRDAHLVYIAHNVETDNRRKVAAHEVGVKRLLRLFDARNAALFEARLLRRASLVVALTPTDAAVLRQRTTAEVIVVAPERPAAVGAPRRAARAVGVCGSTGWSVKRRSQEELITALAPLLARGIRVVVFGSHDADWSARLRAAHPGLEFTGWVADLPTALTEVAVVAIHEPLGGGFQMRLLDVLAAGRPVVGTRESLRSFRDPAAYALACSDLAAVADAAAMAVDDDGLRDRLSAEMATQLAWIDTRGDALRAFAAKLLGLAEPVDRVGEGVTQRDRGDVGKQRPQR